MWPHGQAVKTPPFHGGNMGSSPVGVTKKREQSLWLFSLFANLFKIRRTRRVRRTSRTWQNKKSTGLFAVLFFW